MNTSFLLCAFQIIVINLVMSADNVGAIALAIRNLPKDLMNTRTVRTMWIT